MSLFQNQNQFNQQPVLGQVDMGVNPNIIPVRINPDSSSTHLQVAQAMKLISKVGSEIIVDEAAITEEVYGYIVYNPQKNLYAAGDHCELACEGSVIYLEASAAVNRGAKLANTPSGPTVATDATGTHWPSAKALGQVSGAGILRCQVKIQAAANA